MRTGTGVNSVDTWSWVHLFGSWCLAMALWKIGIPCPYIVSFLFGLSWECIDGLYAEYRISHTLLDQIWDKRGFSWLDLIFDGIGCAGALWLIS